MASFSARYDAGDHDAVWRELRALGPRGLEGPLREDVDAVAHAMARRARSNVDTLVRRLAQQGFTARHNDADAARRPAHLPPTPDAPALADWLDDTFGPVPRTVLAWIRVVGDVWLVGSHPDWSGSHGADPLVVELEYSAYGDPRDFYLGEHDAWEDRVAEDAATEQFQLDFAPDRLHKSNVSGGPPYGVVVPYAAADAVVTLEGGRTSSFVEHLNDAFAAGGFPGHVPAPPQLRERLADGLLRL